MKDTDLLLIRRCLRILGRYLRPSFNYLRADPFTKYVNPKKHLTGKTPNVDLRYAATRANQAAIQKRHKAIHARYIIVAVVLTILALPYIAVLIAAIAICGFWTGVGVFIFFLARSK